MATKQIGRCPFCGNIVEATIVEPNNVRRDKCKCPDCEQPIYVCRSPGCHDYAKGTATYDHELCPECTKTAMAAGAEIGKTGLKIVGAVGGGLLLSAMKKK